MQEQNKDQIYQKLIECMESTEDFVLEQAPDAIRQALRYEKVAAAISIITMALLLIASLSISYYFWKHPTLDKYDSRDLPSMLGIFLPWIPVLPLFLQLCDSIDKLIKINIAPKYFLIQLLTTSKS